MIISTWESETPNTCVMRFSMWQNVFATEIHIVEIHASFLHNKFYFLAPFYNGDGGVYLCPDTGGNLPGRIPCSQRGFH